MNDPNLLSASRLRLAMLWSMVGLAPSRGKHSRIASSTASFADSPTQLHQKAISMEMKRSRDFRNVDFAFKHFVMVAADSSSGLTNSSRALR
eukprot:9279207-Pyramimonas_sp.AAC.1